MKIAIRTNSVVDADAYPRLNTRPGSGDETKKNNDSSVDAIPALSSPKLPTSKSATSIFLTTKIRQYTRFTRTN